MRFMLLQDYAAPAGDCTPMTEWAPEEIEAHVAFQHALNAELVDNGEFVDAQGLAGPEQAKFVHVDPSGNRVVTDGPFPESKELVAGYRTVDVESLDRALEIAAQASAAPGVDGVPMGIYIEVRQIMGAP